jgi:integrase
MSLGVNSLIKSASDMSISRYSRQAILDWLSDLIVGKTTQHNYLRGVRYIFNQAVKQKKIKDHPCEGIIRKMPESKREFLTYEELNKVSFVNFDVPVIKDAFLFSCYTGLRLGDIRLLQWKNISYGYIEHIQSKTGHVERIKLHNEALKIVKRQPHITEFVFNLHAQKRFYIHFRRMMDQVGLDKYITFHCARHTFATLLLTYDQNIYAIKELLGHRDVKTTQIYANLLTKKRISL